MGIQLQDAEEMEMSNDIVDTTDADDYDDGAAASDDDDDSDDDVEEEVDDAIDPRIGPAPKKCRRGSLPSSSQTKTKGWWGMVEAGGEIHLQ